ncbi:hypothetical protein [Bordetella sp. 15P40C-2]|uniref:hypothetical protein n=1 Tax=Bordetella sp. 15P40C-2 TaxID=2572246 RepID=UPI00132A5936|nr:hypothetical protein [Bordetella sp. 15P40C-2]MVW72123.1 hypothetical protein [Bordetella sp. 15P40C-2]
MRHRFLTTDVCARLFCVVFLTYMGLAALTVRTTVPGRLVAMEGDWTIVIFLAILAIAGAVLVDVIVNSILPDRYAWQWVKSRRDLLYIISALLSIIPSWYMTKTFGLSYAGSIFYLGAPILIFHLALCDIKAKYGAQVNEAR